MDEAKGQVSNEATGSNGAVLSYKHAGEEKVLDLTDPEQLRKAQVLISKGEQYDKVNDELAGLRRKQGDFDKLMLDAKDDDSAFKAVQGMIEGFTGRKFGTVEEIEDHFDALPKKELGQLEKKVEALQNQLVKQQMDSELNALARKYDDFDKEAVLAKARETGVTDFDLIHHAISKDNAVDKARKELLEKTKTTQEKRRNAATEGGNHAPPASDAKTNFKNYKEISENIAADIKSGKYSLFDDD